MSEHDTGVKSLAHTKWNCKYHIVFAPKYRRKCFSINDTLRMSKSVHVRM